MKMITAPIREMGEYEEIHKALGKHQSVALTGCVDSQKVHMLYSISDGFPVKIIATYSDLRAKEIYEDCRLYDRSVVYYPAKDLIFYQADVHGNELVKERMKCIRKVLEGGEVTIVTTFDSLMTPQVPPEIFAESILSLEKGTSLPEKEIENRLAVMGYEKN